MCTSNPLAKYEPLATLMLEHFWIAGLFIADSSKYTSKKLTGGQPFIGAEANPQIYNWWVDDLFRVISSKTMAKKWMSGWPVCRGLRQIHKENWWMADLFRADSSKSMTKNEQELTCLKQPMRDLINGWPGKSGLDLSNNYKKEWVADLFGVSCGKSTERELTRSWHVQSAFKQINGQQLNE